MIKIENLICRYDSGSPVLDHIGFTVDRGEKVGLIGANGAGKTTLLKCLPGLVAFSGSITVDDVEVGKKTLPEIRKKLGFVLQNSDDQMFMPTVLEDMIFGPMNYGMSGQQAKQNAEKILELLHLEHLIHKYNHKMSGGEKRMAAIATVLAMEPEYILMDEPTAALDPVNRRLVINTIKALPQACIITSHDLDMIYDTCTRVILIGNGKIAADGTGDAILRNEALLNANHLELPLCFQ